MTDESYIHTLCEQYLRDECKPGYDNLDPSERAGVLSEIVQDDPEYGHELLGNIGPIVEGDNELPQLLAKVLDARAEDEWAKVAALAPEFMAHLIGRSVLEGKAAIDNALDAAFEQAEQDARERLNEDDGRGDYLYQVRKDDALTGGA